MRKSEITVIFTSDIQNVWGIVTNNEDFKWRSDLDYVEKLESGQSFIERTKEGFQTKFIITKKVKYQLYEFKIKNKRFTE